MSLFENKNCVVGLGGVGGYIGALLADTYPHVSFVARGARKKAIDEHGLILHSDYRGERIVHPEKQWSLLKIWRYRITFLSVSKIIPCRTPVFP